MIFLIPIRWDKVTIYFVQLHNFKKNNNNCVPTNLNISTFQYKAFLDFQYKAFTFTLKSEKIIIFLVMYMQLTKKLLWEGH